MTITGGTFSTLGSTAADIVGNGEGFTGTLNISGGNFIGTSFGTSMGAGGGTIRNSILNVNNGTATLFDLSTNTVTATVNLNGGTLAMNKLAYAGSGANNINFNGGTLKARVASTTFIATPGSGSTTVSVKAGGAIIDTDTFDITIARPILTDAVSLGGGITKNNTGLLTLGATSTTTGPADVNAGGLGVKGSAVSWAPSSFSHSGNALNFDLGVYSLSNPAVINTGVLTVDSAVTVNVTGSNFQVAQIPLIQYTSKNFTGGSLTLNPATLPPNVVATLVDNNAGLIYLDVTAAPTSFVWSGNTATPGTGDWDTSSLNWNTFLTPFSTAGTQVVEFPSITGGGTVTLTSAYSPVSIAIANATGNPYTFTGAGKITGATAINKSSTGRAIFASGTHDYTGATTISGGALIKQAADTTTGNISVTADNVSFVLDGGVTDGTGQTLFLAGRGITTTDYFFAGSQVQRGALQAQNGANSWQGDIVLTSNSASNFNRIGVQPGASLTLTGNISENVVGAYLLFRAGAIGDNITLGGAGTYSYTNETQMFSTGGAIILGNNNKLPTGKLLNLTSNGSTIFDLNGYSQEFAGIYGGAYGAAATITNNGGAPSVLTSTTPPATSSNCFALIADGSNAISIVKNGDGIQTLSFLNTYSGTTTVNGGTLRIYENQSTATGAVQVNAATLGGTGTIGGAVTVAATGTIAPGVTTGLLTVPSADLSAGGTLAIEINDASTPKVDRLTVTGALNVTNAKLTFSVTGTPAEASYVIASASAITGTIAPGNVTGLPSGYTLVQTSTEIRLDQGAVSDYSTWMNLYPSITAPADKLPTADPDADGLTNQQEYAYGLAPNSGSSVNPILVQLNKTAGTFTYQRRSSTGLNYTIWTSPDLITWTQDTTAIQAPGTPDGNNVQSVVTTLTGAPLTATKLFVRVKAQ